MATMLSKSQGLRSWPWRAAADHRRPERLLSLSLSLSLCIYIYMYIYIYTYILYIYVYPHTNICTYIYVCVYTYVYNYIYIYIYTHTHTRIHLHCYAYVLVKASVVCIEFLHRRCLCYATAVRPSLRATRSSRMLDVFLRTVPLHDKFSSTSA